MKRFRHVVTILRNVLPTSRVDKDIGTSQKGRLLEGEKRKANPSFRHVRHHRWEQQLFKFPPEYNIDSL